MKRLLIAIDGPAGSGKSTVARLVAKRLGLRYLDTGATYRAAAWKAMQQRANPEDRSAIGAICRALDLQIEADPDRFRVFVDGQDITEQIRLPGVGEFASKISAYPEVRAVLVAFQQSIAQGRGIVVEGRDAQTVVCPDADLKVLLTASVAERAKRRWLELRAKHPEVELEAITKEVAARDARDETRAASPLRAAQDAVVINSDGLTADQVVSQIVTLARERAIQPSR
jgi:cytidylate kinase